MNPMFIKRFLKYNKSLVAVIGVSLIIVLFMLVIVIFKYLEMVQANTEVTQMRNVIKDLQDARKNKVAVIEGNFGRLKEDYQVYSEKNELIRPYFGHPYNNALDAMAKEMKWKNGDDVAKKFYDYLNVDTNEDLNNRYKRFKREHNSANRAWDRAIAAFMKEAQKVSFEVIDADNVDDIFLQSIGLPREMVGRDYAARAEVLSKNEIKLRTYVLTKKIEIEEAAQDFSLRQVGMNKFADAMQNMEIVGDLVPRLIKSAPAVEENKGAENNGEEKNNKVVEYIKSINTFNYLGKSEYPEDNNVIVHKYRISFTGTMEALRNVIRDLNSAIFDNRVYVLRNLKLNVPEKDSEIALVLGITKVEAEKDEQGVVREVKMKSEDHLPYNKRRDYGKTLIGNNPFFNITMDLDYMILKQHEYQRR